MLEPERRWLHWRRSASTGLYRWAGVLVVLFAFGPVIKFGDWTGVYVALVIFAGTLLIEYLDRGYRISYDEQAVFMRPHGVFWTLRRRAETRIPYGEIELVAGERSARSVSYGNRFTPFEFAHVYRRGGGELGEEFALVGGELHHDDFREILRVIDQRAPGTLDQLVRAWLEGSRRF